MAITLDGTTGITTPAETNSGNLLVTGNVGIGTASPTNKLSIEHNSASNTMSIRNNDTTGFSALQVLNSAGTEKAVFGYGNSSAPVFTNGAYVYTPDYFSIATGGTTEQAGVTSTGLFKFNSGYGSSATVYGCRAWVNFNGTGTVAIRASGNVSSITDNAGGDYTINMTNAMPDANYAVHFSGNGPTVNDYNNQQQVPWNATPTTSSVRVFFKDNNAAGANGRDCLYGFVTIFR